MRLSTKMHNQPKPAFARYRVEYEPGRGYAIVDPDGTIVARQGNRDMALTRAEALQRQADAAAKRGPRACLCCGATFQSEGIHNRMCSNCRGIADATHSYGGLGVQDGRKYTGVRRA